MTKNQAGRPVSNSSANPLPDANTAPKIPLPVARPNFIEAFD
jgi:hypothetical protein